MMNRLRISDIGVSFIKKLEGLRLEVYLDQAGKKTIGYGHLLTKTEDYEIITKEAADILLRQDLAHAQDIINNLKPENIDLLQHEFDALVSLVYNIGYESYRNSSVLMYLKLNRKSEIPLAFMKWVKITSENGGLKISTGLIKRRLWESLLFKGELNGEFKKLFNE